MRPGDTEWQSAVAAAVANSTIAQGLPERVQDARALDAIARTLSDGAPLGGAALDTSAASEPQVRS